MDINAFYAKIIYTWQVNDVNKALRIFKKKLQNEGILQEYKERQHYVKPSEKKRRTHAEH